MGESSQTELRSSAEHVARRLDLRMSQRDEVMKLLEEMEQLGCQREYGVRFLLVFADILGKPS